MYIYQHRVIMCNIMKIKMSNMTSMPPFPLSSLCWKNKVNVTFTLMLHHPNKRGLQLLMVIIMLTVKNNEWGWLSYEVWRLWIKWFSSYWAETNSLWPRPSTITVKKTIGVHSLTEYSWSLKVVGQIILLLQSGNGFTFKVTVTLTHHHRKQVSLMIIQ